MTAEQITPTMTAEQTTPTMTAEQITPTMTAEQITGVYYSHEGASVKPYDDKDVQCVSNLRKFFSS